MSIRLAIAASCMLIAGACSGAPGESDSVAWSSDPCGLAPPTDVASAFGIDPSPIGGVPQSECRYQVGDTLLRVIVVSDRDACEGLTRSYAALGESLTRPDGADPGVFVSEPGRDIVVCHSDVTYVLRAAGRAEQLLVLARTSPSQRSD